jgi:hypothetical protein
MRTFTFYWADGHISSESFDSDKELYEYIDAMSEDIQLDRYENENGMERWE